MSSNVVLFRRIGDILQKSGQTSLVGLMQQAFDLHYDSGRDENGRPVTAEHYLAEDLYEVMKDAEPSGQNKLQAIEIYLKQILEPYQDQIRDLYDSVAN